MDRGARIEINPKSYLKEPPQISPPTLNFGGKKSMRETEGKKNPKDLGCLQIQKCLGIRQQNSLP